MGYTHVEFLPLTEHPFDGSWGYQPIGYFAPTSRFGTPDDFMSLVDTLHRRGIGVILDWVPAHFPDDEHGLGYFDGTHLYEHADPRQGRHPDWGTLHLQLRPPRGRQLPDQQRPVLARQVPHRRPARGRRRLDALPRLLAQGRASGSPTSTAAARTSRPSRFLRRFNERVHAEFPDVLTIAEESTAWPMVSRPTNVGGLGFDLKWDMGWMHDTLDYMALDPLYRKHHHNLLTFRGALRLHRELTSCRSRTTRSSTARARCWARCPATPGRSSRTCGSCCGWMYAQPGKKLLFMGDEFGQWREWNHDTSLDWHLLDDPLHQGLQPLGPRPEHALPRRAGPARARLPPDGLRLGRLPRRRAERRQPVPQGQGRRRRSSSSSAISRRCRGTTTGSASRRAGTGRRSSTATRPLYGGSGQGNIGGVRDRAGLLARPVPVAQPDLAAAGDSALTDGARDREADRCPIHGDLRVTALLRGAR